MRHLILNSLVIAGLLTAPAAYAQALDGDSEATVAMPSYDPTNEDCKCLGPKKVVLPANNPAYDAGIVNWITSDSASGEPPALPSPGVK